MALVTIRVRVFWVGVRVSARVYVVVAFCVLVSKGSGLGFMLLLSFVCWVLGFGVCTCGRRRPWPL
jgi:hypothetical protein